MKKYRAVLLCAAAVLAAISILHIRECIKYDIMNYEAQLMAQIKEEQQIYSDSIFESAAVDRPRYSRSVREWTFVVKLTSESAPRYYKYIALNRSFIQIA